MLIARILLARSIVNVTWALRETESFARVKLYFFVFENLALACEIVFELVYEQKQSLCKLLCDETTILNFNIARGIVYMPIDIIVYIDLYNGLIVSECFTITCEFLY